MKIQQLVVTYQFKNAAGDNLLRRLGVWGKNSWKVYSGEVPIIIQVNNLFVNML